MLLHKGERCCGRQASEALWRLAIAESIAFACMDVEFTGVEACVHAALYCFDSTALL